MQANLAKRKHRYIYYTDEYLFLNRPGVIFENIVAQMLQAKSSKLYFYSRKDNFDSKNTMEIDFLIIDPGNPTKISPIEVKSGKRYLTSSLVKFKRKFRSKIGQSFLLHTKDLMIKDGVHYLPISMTMCLLCTIRQLHNSLFAD